MKKENKIEQKKNDIFRKTGDIILFVVNSKTNRRHFFYGAYDLLDLILVFRMIQANKKVMASAAGCAKHNPSKPNRIGNRKTSGKKKNPCRAAARTVLRNARPTACK